MPFEPRSRAEADLSAEERARETTDLVNRAKVGDRRAFGELVRRYRPRIYALALHLTGEASDADDITQDAFLKAFSKLPEFEGRSQFFTWLYRITLHRALNVKRNRKRRQAVGLDDARVNAAIAVDASGDPRKALELREDYAILLTAFDELSASLKTTVVLTTLQGLSYKETAVILETTEGTVAWRVHEARRRLKEIMDQMLKEPAHIRLRKIEAVALKPDGTLPSLESALIALNAI